MSHTKGFLKVSGTGNVVGENRVICLDASPEDARRIVACWNACAGISTENLEENHSVKWLAEQYNTAVNQRDELLAELKSAIEHIDFKHEAYARACALIEKIEGEK